MTANELCPSGGVYTPKDLVTLTGNHSAARMLAQLLYWQDKMQREFYKTDVELAAEISVSVSSVKRARAKLVELQLITCHRKGMPARNYYAVNEKAVQDGISQLAHQLAQNELTSQTKMSQHVSSKRSNLHLYRNTTEERAEETRSSQLEDRTIADEYPSSEARFHEQLKGRGDPVIKGLQARDFFRFNCSQKLCNLYPDKLADWFRNHTEAELLRIWKFSAGARPGKLREWNMHDMLEGTLDIPSKPREVEKAEKEVQNALRMVSILGAEDALAMLEPETRRVYTDWHGKTPEQAAAS